MSKERTYPIKVVANRTGLTPHAIRAWEKRYGAVRPQRTETNRRRYSEKDLERLILLSRLKEGGYNIGAVAGLSTSELETLLSESSRPRPAVDSGYRPRATERAPADMPGAHVETCMGAIERLDGEALTLALEGAAISLTQPVLLLEVVLPLLTAIGERWHSGTLRPSQEHLATAAIRSFLSGLMRSTIVPTRAPRAVVTTPTGQMHDISAQVAALTAMAGGWRVLFLGASLPAEEIANAARQSGARAVILSIVYPPDDPRLPEQLTTLKRNLPDDVGIFAGGPAASAYAETLESIGAARTGTMIELHRQLDEFRAARTTG